MTADLLTLFSDDQTVTGTDTTVQSTSWIDLQAAMDFAAGRSIEVDIIVTTTFSGGTSVQPQLCACEYDGSNPVVLNSFEAIPIASLVAPGAGTPGNLAGSRFTLRASPARALPAISGSDPRQALRMQYVLVGAVAAGKLTAQLVQDAGSARPGKAYPGT